MTGRAALEAVERDKPDLIVLDLGLPDIDGVEVCRQVRADVERADPGAVRARQRKRDKVSALDAGADDYVTKPFGAEELLARIRATLRRVENPSPPSEPIVRGDLVIDRERFRVLRDGEEVRLTPKEFELLTFLAQHPGPRADAPHHPQGDLGLARWSISRSTCGCSSVRCERRSKPNPSSPKYILTEPWVGYRFADA